MIELKQVSKDFGTGQRQVHAVREVSLSIEEGEIFGIIGFSGAGKSTLVRCINLLERPTAGTVTVDGREMTALSQRELRQARKKIGMIFQHFNLMPSRTVFGNVAYPLWGSGLSKQEISEKVRGLLELVGIADKAEAYPSQLSGGQKQRVAIARALANDPSVLLCDEATSALDPQTTKSILRLLKHLNETLGITVVIITHEMAVVKEMQGERDEETWKRELRENMEKAYAEAYRLGGVASGEHGIGTAKRHYFLRETPQENLTTMNRLKDALDPLHILNDQKAYIETKRRG